MRTLKSQLLAALLSGAAVFAVLQVSAWSTCRDMRNVCPRQDDTRRIFHIVSGHLEEHRKQHGTLPESLAGIADLPAYLSPNGRAVDAWGRPLRYQPRGEAYDLSSLGRDGKPGGLGLDADLYHEDPTRDLTAPTFRQWLTVRDPREIESGRFVFAGLLAGGIVAVVVFQSVRDMRAREPGLGPVPLLLSVAVVTSLACVVGAFLLPLHVPSGH